jgi:hypothetical protein
MSNGGFGGIHGKLLAALASKFPSANGRVLRSTVKRPKIRKCAHFSGSPGNKNRPFYQVTAGQQTMLLPEQRLSVPSIPRLQRQVMLTRRRTVAVEVSTCTGRAAPSRMGPMVTPSPPVILIRL